MIIFAIWQADLFQHNFPLAVFDKVLEFIYRGFRSWDIDAGDGAFYGEKPRYSGK